MIDPLEKSKIGQILLEMGVVSDEQLKTALEIKNKNPKRLLGEIIVEIGYSTHKDIIEAISLQEKQRRLGQLLVKSYLISKEELDKALDEQAETKQKLGEILIQHGFCSREQVERILKLQYRYKKE